MEEPKSLICTIIQRDRILAVTWDKLFIMIFSPYPPIARNRSSGETAIDRMSSGYGMRPSRVRVAVSQNATVRRVEYAMNFPCFGRAMHERLVVSETGHSETASPVEDSNCLIALSDTTKRLLLNQRRPVLYHGFTVTSMSMSKQPSLLSQTRTKSRVAVAIRSPCGEYLAAITHFTWWCDPTEFPWWSVCTRSRVSMSQMVAVSLSDAETRRVESGEKSTPINKAKNLLQGCCKLSFISPFDFMSASIVM